MIHRHQISKYSRIFLRKNNIVKYEIPLYYSLYNQTRSYSNIRMYSNDKICIQNNKQNYLCNQIRSHSNLHGSNNTCNKKIDGFVETFMETSF
jgi:hypothetical protein